MVAVAIPVEIQRSSLILTSGQVLFPLDDSPHITHDGIILHGRSALQRAMVYRILHHTECLPSPSCTVGVGQARPPLPSPFHSYTLCRQCTEPLKAPCHRSHHGSCRNLSLPPPYRSQQEWVKSKSLLKLTPHVSLVSWEYMPYKRSLSRIWPQGMMRRMHVLVVSSKLVQEMCAPWRATSNILFRAYTAIDNISVSSRGQMRVGLLSVRWTALTDTQGTAT